ncbi:VTC domain-containing protein [Paraphysoderma sedebokerense]|nr:VTC domain-containing protein [Paraphysoderma sedebokerense]
MKFGVHLQEVQYPEWRYYYIDYDGLKRQLKEMTSSGKDCGEQVEAAFVEFLERELEKVVASFLLLKSGELNRRAQHCESIINNIIKNPTATPQIERIARVEDEISHITTETNELAKYTRLNYTGFLKILKKHDKHTIYMLKPMFMVRLNARPFYRENFEKLILKLSNLYDILRNGGHTSGGNAQADGGSQNFVRQTTKYWVHPDNVTEVKLRILKHLPVLIFNSKNDPNGYNPAITSIYFDNEAFDLYKGRLEKTEGAQAIRFRWYGNVSNTEIFIERKTHREDWTGEKSVKSRFPLKEKYVNAYMNGEYTTEKTVQKMRERKMKSDKEIVELETLSKEIQESILNRNLRPTLRTFYNRTAFQLPGDARVRISLDTELCMIREDNYDSKERAGTNWRRTDIGIDFPFSQLEEADICRFPYAVLEVKLQTQLGAEPPKWVQELVESHLVEEVPKFSKFIHGCATLLENRVSLLPFWLPQMDKDIRKPAPKRSYSTPTSSPYKNQLTTSSRRLSFRKSKESTVARDADAKGKQKEYVTVAIENGNIEEEEDDGRDIEEDTDEDELAELPNGEVSSQGGSDRQRDDEEEEEEEEVERESDEEANVNEDTPLLSNGTKKDRKMKYGEMFKDLISKLRVKDESAVKQLRVLRRKSAQGSSSSGSRRGESRGDLNEIFYKKMNGKRIVIPVRVEPKVFFANERTFLSWLHFCMVLSSLSLALLNFGDKVGQISGIIFTVIAMGLKLYALWLYNWRANMIRNREPGPYDDRGGPVVIVVVLFIAILINFWLKLTHDDAWD